MLVSHKEAFKLELTCDRLRSFVCSFVCSLLPHFLCRVLYIVIYGCIVCGNR